MDKAKRKPKIGYFIEPNWPVLYGRVALMAACVYALIVVIGIPALFPIYGTLSGIILMFFWPILCFEAFLLLLANQQRLRGWRNYPRGTHFFAAALALMTTSAFYLLSNGFTL
jgi:hypothetical protein